MGFQYDTLTLEVDSASPLSNHTITLTISVYGESYEIEKSFNITVVSGVNEQTAPEPIMYSITALSGPVDFYLNTFMNLFLQDECSPHDLREVWGQNTQRMLRET